MTSTHIPLEILISALLFLLILSAFFSGSETSLMSINRYKLRHSAKTNKKANRVYKLLKRPDRILGVILIGNNFANISASAIATLIGQKVYGEYGVLIATIILTVIVLIFAEITPKTLAAIKSEKIAYKVSFLLQLLLWGLYPLVILTSFFSTGILKIFGIKKVHAKIEHLNREELKSVLNEAGGLIPNSHQAMLLSILDLEKVTVNDILIPKTELVGIDINEDLEIIMEKLTTTNHTLLPVYNKNINDIKGILHMKKIASIIENGNVNINSLLNVIIDPYFVPENTSLHTQLLNFKKNKCRMALVVDEYGDIQGMITLEDLLEEIVGEFTSDFDDINKDIHIQEDGTYIVDGSVYVRELNKELDLKLPITGAKTLSGLIIEHLETIPNPKTSVLIANYPIEAIDIKDNMVKTAKISKRLPDKNIKKE